MNRLVDCKVLTKEGKQMAHVNFGCKRPDIMKNDSLIKNAVIYAIYGQAFDHQSFENLFNINMQAAIYVLEDGDEDEIMDFYKAGESFNNHLEEKFNIYFNIIEDENN